MIRSYGISEAGLVRRVNEDRIFLGRNFFVLADGMGGYEGGQIASQSAVEAVRDFFEKEGERRVTEETVREAVLGANRAILSRKMKSREFQDMGTTLIVTAVSGGRLYWAHVGDSRLYVMKDGALTQITKDHSFVMTLLEEGKITKEEMRGHPRKNEITRAVGIRPSLDVDTGCLALDAPLLVLICSDGLSALLDDEVIRASLARCGNGEDALRDCAEELLREVYDAGATDNISAIFIQFTPDAINGAEP